MKQRAALALGVMLALSGSESSAQDDGACQSSAYEVPVPLVGVWHEYTVTPTGESYEGELRSSLEVGGCAFVQSFVSRDGSFTFQSLGFVDPTTGAWRERFVLSNGATAEYFWARDGEDLLLNRGAPGGTVYRLRITSVTTESYTVIEERLDVETQAWTQGERTMTRRAEPGR